MGDKKLGSFSQQEHQDGLKSALARRRRRFFSSEVLSIHETTRSPRRSLGAMGCAVLFAVRVCKVRRRTTHAAHQTSGAIGCHATLSAPATRALIEIEKASLAAALAKHSSPRAFKVRGNAVDAPHGNSSKEQSRPLTSMSHLHRHAHAPINGNGDITPIDCDQALPSLSSTASLARSAHGLRREL